MNKISILFSGILMAALLLVTGCQAVANTTPTEPNPGSNASTANTPSSPTATESPKATLSALAATPAPASSDPTSAYQPPPLKYPPQYALIKDMLSPGGGEHGTYIPLGSTIYHWRNKITEVVGPDNSVVFIARDSEAVQINTPGGGPAPATGGLQVPSGALAESSGDRVMIIFNGLDRRNIIATTVRKPEDFPYAPTQLRSTAQQYVAAGTYADGSTGDVTSQVSWNSSDPGVAIVSPGGLVTALANGHTQITVSLNGVTSVQVDLTVNTLSSISMSAWGGVGPPMPFTSLAVGSTRRVWATGTYSDGLTLDITSEVTWASADNRVATIDSEGMITGVTGGNDTVTSSLHGVTSDPLAFAVVSAPQTPTTAH